MTQLFVNLLGSDVLRFGKDARVLKELRVNGWGREEPCELRLEGGIVEVVGAGEAEGSEFSEGMEDRHKDPFIWVACNRIGLDWFAKADMKLMFLEDGFLVCLKKGILTLPVPGAEEGYTLTRATTVEPQRCFWKTPEEMKALMRGRARELPDLMLDGVFKYSWYKQGEDFSYKPENEVWFDGGYWKEVKEEEREEHLKKNTYWFGKESRKVDGEVSEFGELRGDLSKDTSKSKMEPKLKYDSSVLNHSAKNFLSIARNQG